MAEAGKGFRERLHEVVFKADTRQGRLFDEGLLAVIAASVALAMLESVPSLQASHGRLLLAGEWAITILFSAEYLLRLYCAPSARRYAFSFFGVVDFLAITPLFVAFFLPAGRYLTVIRLLRLLRIFRILKLVQYVGEAESLVKALAASVRKIIVFLFAVLILVTILGSLMYVVEGEHSGFTSIPLAVYWAVVTLTTVGYGDITPQTNLGQALSACIMILGYGIIVVPISMFSADMVLGGRERESNWRPCPACGLGRHDADALHCKRCGAALQ